MTETSAILYISAMEIDSIVVTGRQVATIRDLLSLDCLTVPELNRLRNKVVRVLADASSAARNDGDWKAYDRLSTAMSATTAVIDETLFNRGALY